jgi:hypothetical protein
MSRVIAIDRFASLALVLRLRIPTPLVVPARIEFGLNMLAFMPLTLLASLLRPAVTLSAWTAAGFGGPCSSRHSRPRCLSAPPPTPTWWPTPSGPP